jgi:hypothetical protein
LSDSVNYICHSDLKRKPNIRNITLCTNSPTAKTEEPLYRINKHHKPLPAARTESPQNPPLTSPPSSAILLNRTNVLIIFVHPPLSPDHGFIRPILIAGIVSYLFYPIHFPWPLLATQPPAKIGSLFNLQSKIKNLKFPICSNSIPPLPLNHLSPPSTLYVHSHHLNNLKSPHFTEP